MRNYDITRECQIVLYGFNRYTKKQIEILREQGFSCRGIIDRCAEAIKGYQGIKLVSDITELGDTGNVCVFIMLRNALNHMQVARTLYQQGVRKIIFVPMEQNFYDREVQCELIIKYNAMLQHQYASLKNIPYVSEDFFERVTEPFCSVAMEFHDDVIAWVSAEKIYTTVKASDGYDDIPIAAFKPYISLFEFLEGGEADISEYVSLFGISAVSGDDRKKEIVTIRKQLFDYFENEINRGLEYFVVSAPSAQWNENGYLNLRGGHHRCMYLLNKGYRKIPVRISYEAVSKLNAKYSQYHWSNEYFGYIIAVQKFLGRDQLCNIAVMCAEGFPETIKQNLQCCKALITDSMNEAEIYFDYDMLISDYDAGSDVCIMQLVNAECRRIICLDYKNCLTKLLKKENYQKKGLRKLLVDYKEMELCVFERREIQREDKEKCSNGR